MTVLKLTPEQETIFGRRNSLGQAIQANDIEWAKIYMDQTTDKQRPSQDQLTTLFFKTLSNLEPATADFLLEYGADPQRQFTIQLPDRMEVVGLARILINQDQTDLFQHLFEKGVVDMSQRSVGGDSLLAQSLTKENVALADWLFARGAAVDEANFLGFTALHQAANRINFIAVEWLLDHGANPEATTIENDSVPSQLIPTADETGDADALYDILEDYSESYGQGAPVVPQALRAKCDELRAKAATDAAPEADADATAQIRKPRR